MLKLERLINVAGPATLIVEGSTMLDKVVRSRCEMITAMRLVVSCQPTIGRSG
jgi:hypothetical protein